MIRFVIRKIKKIDKAEWDSFPKNILLSALDDEVIMIYKDGVYYGHVDMHTPLNIMIPERNSDFEPQELLFNDEVVEKAYEIFRHCRNLCIIPVKLALPVNDIMIFASYKMPADDLSVYECAIAALDTYDASERTRKLFVSRLLKGKEVIVLNGLNEFTYKCYCMLENTDIQIRVEGEIWSLVGVRNTDTIIVPDEQVYHMTPEYISEVAAVINAEECVYVKDLLCKKGIDAYTLLVPTEDQINEYSAMEEIMRTYPISFNRLVRKKYRTKLEDYFLRKFLRIENDGEIGEIPEGEFIHPEILGDEQATIFLIGPCIAGGTAGLESWSLAHFLRRKTSGKYKIKRVVMTAYSMDVEQTVAELDITNQDIVFFSCSNFSRDFVAAERNIDLSPVYNQRKEKLFFQDHLMHTLGVGNEAIAEYMQPYIWKKSEENIRRYLQIGIPRLTHKQKTELDAYIESIRIDKKVVDNEPIGAIVMNANPFTLGHLYLIEKAAASVTYLYVMVVREDLSEFQFGDRLRLVKEGTAQFKNVFVVSSGSFVLSRRTMSEYFQKEELQEKQIDASRDVAFFGAYIAPGLSISVRFVGEEPLDCVTRQYNEEMKEKLPEHGVKVVEIPRKSMGETIISASMVRKYYREGNWSKLQQMLPKVTLQFLESRPLIRNKAILVREMERRGSSAYHWKDLFAENEGVILYAAGKNGKGIYECLSKEEKEKVHFVDIKAEQKSYQFCGKEVESPQTLITNLCQSPIIITTTKFQREACRYLLEIGVEIDRMYQNMTNYS